MLWRGWLYIVYMFICLILLISWLYIPKRHIFSPLPCHLSKVSITTYWPRVFFFLFKPFVESSQNFSIGPWWRSPRWKPPRLPARRRSNLLWRSAGTAHPTASVRLQRPRRRHPWRCLGEKSYESANRQGIGEREYMGCDWNPWFSLSFFKIGDWMLIQKKSKWQKRLELAWGETVLFWRVMKEMDHLLTATFHRLLGGQYVVRLLGCCADWF